MSLAYTIPKVFIGLGNPGDQYNKTRHNLGYEFLDHLSKRYQFTEFKHESKVLGSLSKSILLGKCTNLRSEGDEQLIIKISLEQDLQM